MVEGIKTDYGWTQGKPRNFKAYAKTLERLGCDDFDKYQKLVELKFPKHEKAFAKFSKELHSKDKPYVENFIKLGIMREVIGI
jgi:hypothetical protein